MNSTTQLHKNSEATSTNSIPACVIYYLKNEETKDRKTSLDEMLLKAVDSAFSSMLCNYEK